MVAQRRDKYTELLERTGGGVLVEPENRDQLESTIEQLSGDLARLAELAQRARAGIQEHYGTDEMAARALAAYERLAPATA